MPEEKFIGYDGKIEKSGHTFVYPNQVDLGSYDLDVESVRGSLIDTTYPLFSACDVNGKCVGPVSYEKCTNELSGKYLVDWKWSDSILPAWTMSSVQCQRAGFHDSMCDKEVQDPETKTWYRAQNCEGDGAETFLYTTDPVVNAAERVAPFVKSCNCSYLTRDIHPETGELMDEYKASDAFTAVTMGYCPNPDSDDPAEGGCVDKNAIGYDTPQEAVAAGTWHYTSKTLPFQDGGDPIAGNFSHDKFCPQRWIGIGWKTDVDGAGNVIPSNKRPRYICYAVPHGADANMWAGKGVDDFEDGVWQYAIHVCRRKAKNTRGYSKGMKVTSCPSGGMPCTAASDTAASADALLGGEDNNNFLLLADKGIIKNSLTPDGFPSTSITKPYFKNIVKITDPDFKSESLFKILDVVTPDMCASCGAVPPHGCCVEKDGSVSNSETFTQADCEDGNGTWYEGENCIDVDADSFFSSSGGNEALTPWSGGGTSWKGFVWVMNSFNSHRVSVLDP